MSARNAEKSRGFVNWSGVRPGNTVAVILTMSLLVAGCESAYYGAWEKVGVYKRDILVDRVEDAAQAQEVTQRIDAVEDVSEDLFDEWDEEIGLITNAKYRSASRSQLNDSKRQYKSLISAMRRAESKMPPVLDAFRDQVLFLKHNLNARAIASLRGELGTIETDVASLIRDMEASISQSRAFIEDMELLGGKA